MSEYNFNKVLNITDTWQILIDTDAGYGYWEYSDGTEGGGLWFENNPETGADELVDYDGAGVLPWKVVNTLHDAGYIPMSELQNY